MSNHLIEDVVNKRSLILLSGKGGIGKSFLTASIGLIAASQGKRVCLVESASQDQLSTQFGLQPIGHKLTQFHPNLFGINLDSDLNFRDFVVKHLGFTKLFDKIFSKSVMKSFIKLIPGIAEMTLLGRLYYFTELCDDPNFDLVIFDGSASGHFISLMKTPDAVIKSGMIGPVIDETKRVKEYLCSPKCGTLLVTMGEDLIVSETLETARFFQENQTPHLDGILVNRSPKSEPLAQQDRAELFKQHPQINDCLERLFEERDRYDTAIRKLVDEMNTWPQPFQLPLQKIFDLGCLNAPLDLKQANACLQPN